MNVTEREVQEIGSSAGDADAIVSLLIDAQPLVVPLSAEASHRILQNVLRETLVSVESQSICLTIPRMVLSAAFCVCATAGLLLLQSVASERSTLPQNSRRQIAAQTTPIYMRHVPEVLAYKAPYTMPPTLIKRASIRRGPPTTISVEETRYETPLAPVCGMTSFAIFTPISSSAVKSGATDNRNEPMGESLLICIVNDDQGGAADTPHHADGAGEASLNTGDEVSDLVLAQRNNNPRTFTEEAKPSSVLSPILVFELLRNRALLTTT